MDYLDDYIEPISIKKERTFSNAYYKKRSKRVFGKKTDKRMFRGGMMKG